MRLCKPTNRGRTLRLIAPALMTLVVAMTQCQRDQARNSHLKDDVQDGDYAPEALQLSDCLEGSVP